MLKQYFFMLWPLIVGVFFCVRHRGDADHPLRIVLYIIVCFGMQQALKFPATLIISMRLMEVTPEITSYLPIYYGAANLVALTLSVILFWHIELRVSVVQKNT